MKCQFELPEERKTLLPSYRWISFWPFRIDCDNSCADISDVFEKLAESDAFNRPYIFNGSTHGPFPPGELNANDYERITSEAAKRNVMDAVIGKASWMDEPDPPDEETRSEIDSWLEEIPNDRPAHRLLIDCHTEQDRLHEVGWIMWEFNEHIVIDFVNSRGWFIVIGMD